MNNTDFGTAQNVVTALNRKFGQGTATALDGRVVQVRTPMEQSAQARFLSQIEDAGGARAHRGQGHHQRPHRLGGHEPHRDDRGSGSGSRQPVGHHQPPEPGVAARHALHPGRDRGGAQHADRGAPGKRLAAAREHQRQPGRRGQGPERAGRHAAGPAGHPAGHEVRRRCAPNSRLFNGKAHRSAARFPEGRRGGPAKPDPRGPVGTMDN